MTVLSELKSQGWHLSTEGLELCSENRNNPSASSIIRKALDMDLREIGGNFLPEDMTKGKTEYISGPGVVQIQKIKNASAPKYEYGTGAPPLLRLLLTDGSNYINCLQWGNWKSVSLDTPPGTKLYLKPVKIPMQSNFLLLSDHQFTVLGGCVAPMVEKWELQRKLASHIRTKDNLDGSGPPPWTPFGQQIVGVKQAKLGSNFRALDAESKEAKEDAVFKQQRQANIAEVSRVKETKAKSFGGRKEFQKTASANVEYAPYSQQSNEHFGSENPPRKQPMPEPAHDSPVRSWSYVNERNRKGPPVRNDHSSQQGRQESGRPRSSAAPQASSFVKDNNNKLENRNKLGDFITLEIRQQHTTKPPSDTEASRRYTPINKDYNRPPDRRAQKNWVNAMEQVKIHGYDVEDDSNNLIMAGGSFLVPGTEVMAKYWEDGQYYRALVHAVGKDGKTCVVHFLDYGNYEEILITDIQEKSAPTTFHERNWNAGPISFQPSSRGSNYENYTASPNQNYRDSTKPHQQNANRSYNRLDNAKGSRSEYRPSAKIYKPPGQRTFNP